MEKNLVTDKANEAARAVNRLLSLSSSENGTIRELERQTMSLLQYRSFGLQGY